MKLHGPQTDRNRLWNAAGDSNRADLTSQRESEQIYEAELSQIRHENSSLKDQLQRSLRELRAYQVKYPSPYVAEAAADPDDPEGTLWTMTPNVINPLLEAYDVRILELEDTLKQQTQKLANFKDRMESVMSENEELRARQLEDLRHQGGDNRLAPSGPLNNELLHELNERITILMEENAVLVEQKIVLGTELDKQQSLLSKQTTDMAALSQRLTELAQDQGILQQKLMQAEQDRDEAARHALSCSDALGKAEQEIDELNEQITVLTQRHKEVDLAYADLKKQLKNLSVKVDTDGDQHFHRVQQAEERVRELQLALMARTQDLDNTNEALRKLRLECQSTRQDAEGMLQVMGGMERQLNEYAAKEETMDKAIREAQEKMQQALIVQEQASVRDEQNRLEIQRLQDERRKLQAQRQDDIRKAVEGVKVTAEEQYHQFQAEVQRLTKKHSEAWLDKERAERETRELRNRCDSLQSELERFKVTKEEEFRRLCEQVVSLTVFKEEESVVLEDLQEQNKELRMMIDTYRAQQDSIRTQQFQQQLQPWQHEHEMIQLRSFTKELERQLADKDRLLLKRQQELEEVRARETQLDMQEKHHAQELQSLRQRMQADKQQLVMDLEQKIDHLEKSHQQFLDQFKDQHVSLQQHLEQKLRQEMDRNKVLLQQTRSQESHLQEMLDEKTMLQRLLDDVRERLRSEEELVTSLRATVQELTQQLAQAQQLREEAVYRAARAIEELSMQGLGPITGGGSSSSSSGNAGSSSASHPNSAAGLYFYRSNTAPAMSTTASSSS
jgi:myosin protein heavy chain